MTGEAEHEGSRVLSVTDASGNHIYVAMCRNCQYNGVPRREAADAEEDLTAHRAGQVRGRVEPEVPAAEAAPRIEVPEGFRSILS